MSKKKKGEKNLALLVQFIIFKTNKTLSTEVSGFKDIPTFLLYDLIFLIELIRFLVASGCIVMMSAPASAKFLMKL